MSPQWTSRCPEAAVLMASAGGVCQPLRTATAGSRCECKEGSRELEAWASSTGVRQTGLRPCESLPERMRCLAVMCIVPAPEAR